MTRKDILETAEKMVCGQREQDYGTPENNFQVIADLWNVYLEYAKHDRKLDGFDVGVMMTLFKIGRITSGTCTDDSLVDACGYLACAGEIKAGSENNTAGTNEEKFSEEELLAVMDKYGRYTTPDDPLPYIYCSDCPAWRNCTIRKCDGHFDAAQHILKTMKETKNDGKTGTGDGTDGQGSCDGRYDAAQHILNLTKETKNTGETGTGDDTDEDEFSKEELLAVMEKYGTPEQGHELPYICCEDCPVWLSGRCVISESCDGYYDAARHILKMMKETKNAGESGAGDDTDEEEFSEEELLAVMEKYGKYPQASSSEDSLPYISCSDCPVRPSDHRCRITHSCDGYYDAARHILKTMKENKK